MMRSVTILFSFFVTLSQGEDFNLEQIAGALIIMATIVMHAKESSIKNKCPKLDITFPSCRIDQICYRRVSASNPDDDLESSEPTKE